MYINTDISTFYAYYIRMPRAMITADKSDRKYAKHSIILFHGIKKRAINGLKNPRKSKDLYIF